MDRSTSGREYNESGLVTGSVRSDGFHVVVMGLTAVDECTTFIRTGNGGSVEMKTRIDGLEVGVHRAIVAVGAEWQGRRES